ncbi:hypothetical protein DXG01_011565 [Tephrocybe rancida]|nr:hypothetical protein DXG01_011565 [Tephrocybe rancida]
MTPTNPSQSPTPFSTLPSIHDLPAELVDLVIGHAHADTSLLAACSLVCKAWRPAARHHLFSNTKLNVNNASSFINIVDSETSTVAPFVRHIDANDNCEDGRWVDNHFMGLQPHLLPSLTSISLTSPETLSHTTLSTLHSFNRLKELRLAECEFGDFTQVQSLLCSFPLLESLYLEADWPEPHAVLPTNTSPAPRLRELHLRCEMSHILEWFLMQPAVAPVSKLTLHGLDTVELPIVTRYLQALGAALTRLTIVPSGYVYDSMSDHLDLSFNPCLRYLKLSIDCDGDNLLMASTLLSQLESPAFEEVELSFYSVRQGPKINRQWADLDALLATPPFASSRATITAMSGAAQAKETLPLCQKRGALRTQQF